MDLFAPATPAEIAARVGLHDAELATAVPGGDLDALDDMMSNLASTVSE